MLHHKTREKIEKIALSWVGTPYFENAELKGIGCDCAGLIIGILKDALGVEISRNIGINEALAAHFLPISSPKPADIVIFANPNCSSEIHAALFLSGNKIIHARQNHGVITNNFTRHFQSKVSGFYSLRG